MWNDNAGELVMHLRNPAVNLTRSHFLCSKHVFLSAPLAPPPLAFVYHTIIKTCSGWEEMGNALATYGLTMRGSAIYRL